FDALVARIGLAFGDLGLVEVHAHTEHAHGAALRVAFHHAATLEHPAPGAAARLDAVLGVVILGLAVDVFVELARRLGPSSGCRLASQRDTCSLSSHGSMSWRSHQSLNQRVVSVAKLVSHSPMPAPQAAVSSMCSLERRCASACFAESM